MKEIIHIYGASGSGTSTLGKKICKELGYKFMDTDDYFWIPTNPQYNKKRKKEERLTLIRDGIERAGNVVISGSLVGWGDELIPLFTMAIRLVTDTDTRILRIKKREKQKFGNRIEPGGDMYQHHADFLEWARLYDTGKLNMRSKREHDDWQKLLKCKQIILNGADDIDLNFRIIQEQLHTIIGEMVTVVIDRPLGSFHPVYQDMCYPINYGYIEGSMAADGEEQDAYILGIDKAAVKFTGKVIAVIHRNDDIEEKWVVCPENMVFTEDEIRRQIYFQEQYFNIQIWMR